MPLDKEAQRAVVAEVARAAAAEGCLVAPVGSVFFLFHGGGVELTKDVDLVVHSRDLAVVDTATLERVGRRLGNTERTHDGAVVSVRFDRDAALPDVELVRGRRGAKGGFMPRELLESAAKRAARVDNILLYAIEYVLVLKADAAIDRVARAARDATRAAANLERADQFRRDVFTETERALLSGGLDGTILSDAISCLKASRRAAVADLLRTAGAPVADP